MAPSDMGEGKSREPAFPILDPPEKQGWLGWARTGLAGLGPGRVTGAALSLAALLAVVSLLAFRPAASGSFGLPALPATTPSAAVQTLVALPSAALPTVAPTPDTVSQTVTAGPTFYAPANSTARPTAKATAKASAKPTPTASPSATASPTPTGTASPSPSPTATPCILGCP